MSLEAIEEVKQVNEAPVVAELPELIYEYQPTDRETGINLGGKQVIKYHSQDELVEKLRDQNVELTRLNRDLHKRVKLGDIDQENLPDTLPRLSQDLNFNPRDLTLEERMQVSRDLFDPDKTKEASELLFEATVGIKPEALRQALSRTTNRVEALDAKAEAELFVKSNPDYYVCRSNYETMVNWMSKNNLAPIASNYQYAYDELQKQSLLLTRSTPVPAGLQVQDSTVRENASVKDETLANSQPVLQEPSRITSGDVAQPKRPTVGSSSGLTRNTASDSGVIIESGITLADIEKLPADEYKRRLKDPSFRKRVDELYAKASVR